MTPAQNRDPRAATARGDDRTEHISRLVTAARQGSEKALGQLVTEYSPLLWQVARAAGLDAADAEDVLQTVWLRLIEHLPQLHSPGALAAWLVITTRREAWRTRGAGRRQLPTETSKLAASLAPAPSAEELAVTDDQRRELWQAFTQLPWRCQELLRIVAFVPRPDYQVVAVKLGMPRGSIGPTRGRCLAKLRTLLAGAVEGTAR
jgi:RNA polymerase sigma factor (sigma-70 family)